jgi:endonuclease/exonuclease/phosphatase family metal-dependent hydrolase
MKRFLFLVIALPSCAAILAADRESITVCSYNLENYLSMERYVKGGDGLTPDQPKPEKQIAAVVRFIADIKPDVLGVCEIGQEQDLLDLKARLKTAGIDLPNYEYCHGGDPTRRLGLLTRLPIISRQSVRDLKYKIGDTVWPVQRGFLDVTLRLREGLDVRFIGVHLKSKRPIPDADESVMRRNEAHLLRLHLDEILKADPSAKCFLYGDFNEHRHEGPIVEIIGQTPEPTSLLELHLRDNRKETWTHYWKDADVYSRLDYMFFSRALTRYMNRTGSFIYDTPDYYDGSDHRPLVGKIYLKTR